MTGSAKEVVGNPTFPGGGTGTLTGTRAGVDESVGMGTSVSTGPEGEITPTLDGRIPSATPPARTVVSVQTSRIGRFTLLGQIGQGGMGSVFAAYDEQLDRRVALKLLHQSLAGTKQQRQRTVREAQAVARISHPNVISVYEVGESGEHIYIAMEYVDGETLQAWQSRSPHPWREILEMYLHAGAGLDAAHTAGVFHCDFKPENVLVGRDGRVRLVDFGLARIDRSQELLESQASAQELPPGSESRGRLTLPGIVAGTPGYMPPEQHYGGNVSGRSDQWSYCAALFEALYGYLPFPIETARDRIAKLQGPPRPPPRDTKVPEEVHRALLRGLNKDPSQRFESMAELLDALSLEHDEHAAGGVLLRTYVLRALIGVCCLLLLLVQIRQSQRSLASRDLILASLVTFAAVLGAGIYRRRTLLGNRFNRSLWFVCLATILGNMFQRMITHKLGMPLPWLFPFEMIVLASNIALAAALLIRWLLWLPLVPLASAALAVYGVVPTRILSFTYMFVIFAFAFGWHRASNQRQRTPSPRISGSIPLLRPHSTPISSPIFPLASISSRRAAPNPRPQDERRSTHEAKRWEK